MSTILYDRCGSPSACLLDKTKFLMVKINGLVKSPKTVMPDLIRHPEVIEFTGFRLSPE